MISIYMFYFVLLEIRYRKNLAKLKTVSSEDKGKEAKGKKCDKSKTKQRKMVKENPYH